MPCPRLAHAAHLGILSLYLYPEAKVMSMKGNSDGSGASAVLAVLEEYRTSHPVRAILRLRGGTCRASEFLERGDVERALIKAVLNTRGHAPATSPHGMRLVLAACGVRRTTGEGAIGAETPAEAAPDGAVGDGGTTEAAAHAASTESSSAKAASCSGAVPGGAVGNGESAEAATHAAPTEPTSAKAATCSGAVPGCAMARDV